MTPEVAATILSVPGVLGAVEVLKTMGLPSKAAPLAAIVVGLGAGYLQFLAFPAVNEQIELAKGLAIGLAASGTYSGAEPTQQAIKATLSALVGILPFVGNKQASEAAQVINTAVAGEA